jgi:hypothetical protein
MDDLMKDSTSQGNLPTFEEVHRAPHAGWLWSLPLQVKRVREAVMSDSMSAGHSPSH